VSAWLFRPETRTAAGLLSFAAIAAWRYGIQVALVTTLAFVLGWLAWFDGARAIVLVVRARRPKPGMAIRGAIGIAGCVGLGLTNFAPVVVLSLGFCFVIDLVVLRFRS